MHALPFSDALAFAAVWHHGQRRKGNDTEPFLHHPMRVAARLLRHGLDDGALIQAALLHDVLEDSECGEARLRERFGDEVAGIVLELTDDKDLLKAQRKQIQVERAPLLSLKAKLVRLSDKIDNVHDLAHSPPHGWSWTRRRDYLAWANRVVRALHGTHGGLEREFDETCRHVLAAWADKGA
jgi:guanosine-3',5'-bis(diphosphate) 3'-pyrophosphohydrolase